MAEVVANSEMAVRTRRTPQRTARIVAGASLATVRLAIVLLVAAAIFLPLEAFAQQYGPPTTGTSAAIFFTPATLNSVSGFNPANGHLNGGGYGGDGSLANASASQFSYPDGMAYDTNGNLFIADQTNYIVRRIDHATGILSTFAGQHGQFGFYPTASSAPATTAMLGLLAGLVVDSNNNVYVSDRSNNVVWKITAGGTISLFAGAGAANCPAHTDSIGDGCPATNATLSNPWALGIDSANNLYIADSYNDLVREVSATTGIITIYAGVASDAGSFGSCNFGLYSTTTGPYLPTQAHLCFPEGIAFDNAGNSYIAEATRDDVRIVNSSGYISTFAGTPGTRSSTGNGGPATAATLDEPAGLYVDPAGRVYISDFFGAEIRMVDSSGNINAVMGNSLGSLNNYSLGEPDTEGVLVTGGQYSGAADGIYTVLMDPSGNLLAADSSGDAITSAGTTGQYFFGNINQIYQTATTTSLNAFSAYYPPYVTISNPSGVTLNFTGTPTVTGPFALTGGTCTFPGSLAPGATCTVVASFTPTADQAYTGTIVISSNSSTSPNTILLSGTGIGTCNYTATLTSSLSFSSPPNVLSPTQATTLTNTGICPISTNASSATVVNNNPASSSTFSVVSNNCPATLNGGASCTFNLAFTPTAVTGYTARLQLNIPSYGDIYTNLTGTGITAPAVSFNPTTLTFPATTDGTAASSMSTVLTNIGNASLTGLAITLSGTNPTYFAFNGTNNCGTSLAAGASCTISVNFSPQAAVTTYAANISVADNASGSPQTVPLSATGIAALAAAMVVDNETIHTTDTEKITLPILVLDPETIHTTDIATFPQTALIRDNETIHTTDTEKFAESALIVDNETIHTTDAIKFTQSALILDNEVIHTTDTFALKVLTSPTTTLLASSTATPADGNSVLFTATVSSTGGTPTGSVTFYDGTTALATQPLAGGIATYSTASLGIGAHSISATYLGNPAFLTSTSNTLPETVTDFSIGISAASLTIQPSQSGTYTVTLTPPTSGYSGTISLSATGLPTGATASFSSNPVNLGTTPTTSTLTITVPAEHAQLSPAPRPNPKPFLLLSALLPLFGLRRLRTSRRLRRLAIVLISAFIGMGIVSCGGQYFTEPQQSYTITVTATSGTDQHSATATLTVP
jgi:Bacterial Ig-like domain (group 3)